MNCKSTQAQLAKSQQAHRLYQAVERLALQADVSVNDSIEWLCDKGGMLKLYESYFGSKPPCATCESLARAVMMDQTGKA